MPNEDDRTQAVNIWTARTVPVILLGVVGYATYVTVAQLCVNYLLNKHNDRSAVIAILVVYFLLFVLMIISETRLLYLTICQPPHIPLGPSAIRERGCKKEKEKIRSEEDGLKTGEYDSGKGREDLDSPGLELFYTKDCFVVESDGRPIWCSQCANWKPDRTHHDSSSGRCIAKMDHFCPWVGGPVGENNFKFFIQYTFWTALYCLHLLVIMAFYIRRQITSPNEGINAQFVVILALASFFFLFTASMTGTSIDLALRNLTTVERLRAKTKVHILAIRKPSAAGSFQGPCDTNSPYREITYPLDAAQIALMTAGQPSGQKQQPLSNQVLNDANKDPTELRVAGPVQQIPQTLPAPGAVTVPPNFMGSKTPADPAPSMVQPSNSNAERAEIVPDARQKQSSRDLIAVRTFAVVHTEPGDNPWDLGSPIHNLKSVMGHRVIDWFLPTASPCSNHESQESQFVLGPAVHKLRQKYGLSATNVISEKNNHGTANQTSASMYNGNVPRPAYYSSEGNSSDSPSGDQIKLQNLNGHKVHSSNS